MSQGKFRHVHLLGKFKLNNASVKGIAFHQERHGTMPVAMCKVCTDSRRDLTPLRVPHLTRLTSVESGMHIVFFLNIPNENNERHSKCKRSEKRRKNRNISR